MKKKLLLVTALAFSGCFAFAQQAPPPPPPPKVETVHFEPAKIYEQFLKRNPQVKGLNWSNGNTVHVLLKNGQKETYHLNDAKERRTVENKYGKLPQAPPLPPPAPKGKPPVAPPPPPPPAVVD